MLLFNEIRMKKQTSITCLYSNNNFFKRNKVYFNKINFLLSATHVVYVKKSKASKKSTHIRHKLTRQKFVVASIIYPRSLTTVPAP